MTDSVRARMGTILIGPNSRLNETQQALLAELQCSERERTVHVPGDAPLDPKRRRRVDLTLGEMWAQPQAIAETLDAEAANIREAGCALAARHVRRLYLVGCGDSLSAGIAVRPLFERWLGIQCEAIQALDYAHYLYGNTDDHTAVIAISSSGVTTRTVEAMLRARSLGAFAVGISNTRESALLRESDRGLYVHATRRGWPTQTSTAAMAVLYRLAVEAARAQNVDCDSVEDGLARIPDTMAQVLRNADPMMADLGKALAARPVHLFTGGGPSWATAQFGAAKVRECTPVHSVVIHLEEFHHYNSQKAGDPLFLVAPAGPSLSRAIDAARTGKSWGGFVYAVTGSENASLDDISDLVVRVPPVEEELSPLVFVVPLQLYAYHLAMAQFANAEAESEA